MFSVKKALHRASKHTRRWPNTHPASAQRLPRRPMIGSLPTSTVIGRYGASCNPLLNSLRQHWNHFRPNPMAEGIQKSPNSGDVLSWRWLDVGPASQTLAQYLINVKSTFLFCWENCFAVISGWRGRSYVTWRLKAPPLSSVHVHAIIGLYPHTW